MVTSYIQVPPDSTGKQVATNEVAGKQYQIVNLADDSGSAISPLTDAQLRASALPLPTGAATQATLSAKAEDSTAADGEIKVATTFT